MLIIRNFRVAHHRHSGTFNQGTHVIINLRPQIASSSVLFLAPALLWILLTGTVETIILSEMLQFDVTNYSNIFRNVVVVL